MQPGFDILYEDADFLVASKPAGLLTQAPLGIDSLEVRIKRLLSERDAAGGEAYLGVPHRLDRPVSGAIIFAKSVAAARRMSRQFESRRVEKTYWALVEGDVQPAEGTWTDQLKKIEGEPRTIVVDPSDPKGRVAILHYKVVGTFHATLADDRTHSATATDRTLLEIMLETGRTHQIRVQCADRGHPVLGDSLYGSQQPFGPWRDDERERLVALHARALRFWQHPLKRYIEVIAPLPEYWTAAGVTHGVEA
jgi:23S rRNA pseudouridine1911/1915/1917 synthase